MTINATGSILLALYVAVARRTGADLRKLSGTVQNDILKEYIARGTYIFPPRQAMRIITDMFSFANRELPEWNTISISGYHMREAGSAAVLGGTQSLHTNGFDEALGLPTENAARIALRTQQIVAYETGAANTVDPLAGSYYVESLTGEIETRATLYIEKIDALGGTLKAIEQGYIQREIQNAAYEFQQAVDRNETVVVGVNRFQSEDGRIIPIQRIDEDLERKQVERLQALRARRNKKVWEAALKAVEDTARSGDNLMPRIITAVE